jgi:predicted nucleic acid-binding protein
MTGIVLDASVALAWCFEDEQSAYAEATLDALANQPGVIPSAWALEVANVLALATRKRRITTRQLRDAIQVLRELPLRVEETSLDAVWDRVQPLAARNELTVYDATYIDLALRLGLPLATLDENLRRCAGSLSVNLFEPAA